jgi:hypothetical protein
MGSVTDYETMRAIKEEMLSVDPALSVRLQPNCVYRGGICVEPRSCGRFKKADINHYKVDYA